MIKEHEHTSPPAKNVAAGGASPTPIHTHGASQTRGHHAADTPTRRRTFLGWFLGIGTVSVAGLLSIPLVQFALDPLTRTSTETEWSDLGPADDFKEVDVPQKRTINIVQTDGWRKVMMEKSVYVIKETSGALVVFTATCPHLGCSVKWNDTGKQFKCPCHNGTFNTSGKLTSGPPPRDMDALDSKVEDGHLKVKYQSFRQLVKNKEVLA
jgi:menaquinol-cytochrome c reductase iron-sulfur subunit